MPRQSMPLREATQIAHKVAQEMQVDLIDVELVKEPTGHFLRFYIEKTEGIALSDLEAFHRKILPMVELVEYDFMEVSSPGADRPFKTERDFERAEGMKVELKTYRNINGLKQFSGTLIGLKDGVIQIKAASDEVISFQKKDVAYVRPLIEFDEDDLRDEVSAD